MRRIPAALVVIGLSALALVGCSAGQPPTCDRVPQTGNVGDLVTVTGDVGSAPDVAVSVPFHTAALEYDDVVSGDGTAIVDVDQAFVMGLTIVSGDTGEVLYTLGYDSAATAQTIASWETTVPGFHDALMCATEGSRIVVGLSADDLAEGAGASIGLADGSSAIAVVDLRTVYLSAADGADQFNDGHGLPTVVRAPDGRPGIIVPDADAPAETVVQLLKKGDGAVVADGDALYVNFTQVGWDSKTVSQTSWGSSPAQISVAAGASPIADALIGRPVGSQVLIVTPASADSDSGAQVFVVDILGIGG